MGTVKVENDKVWNEYVKTNKVKGFSIEGYFADKMERPKDKVLDNYEIEAEQLLSKIENIVKGEKLNLSVVDDIRNLAQKGVKIESDLKSSLSSYSGLQRSGNGINKEIDKLVVAAKELGVPIPNEIKGFTEMANRFISIGDAISKVLNKF